MKYGYIYKITYLDEHSHLYNHFYYGQHAYIKGESLYDPNGKYYYHGSSTRAYREYWPYYTKHKKEILCWCNSALELKEKENEYIEQNINDPLCINVVVSNKVSPQTYTDSSMKERISNSLKQYYKEHPEALIHMSEVRKGKESYFKGKHFTEEQKVKIREGAKNRPPVSESTKQKLRGHTPWNKGLEYHTKPCSEETKQKIREKNKIVLKEYFKTHYSPNKGKPMSDEQKEKLRLSHLGKKLSEEHKKKIGDSQRGIPKGPLSEEHKRKISEAKRFKEPHNKGQKGYLKWVYNDIETKMIPIDEINIYINKGYKIGRGPIKRK